MAAARLHLHPPAATSGSASPSAAPPRRRLPESARAHRPRAAPSPRHRCRPPRRPPAVGHPLLPRRRKEPKNHLACPTSPPSSAGETGAQIPSAPVLCAAPIAPLSEESPILRTVRLMPVLAGVPAAVPCLAVAGEAHCPPPPLPVLRPARFEPCRINFHLALPPMAVELPTAALLSPCHCSPPSQPCRSALIFVLIFVPFPTPVPKLMCQEAHRATLISVPCDPSSSCAKLHCIIRVSLFKAYPINSSQFQIVPVISRG